MSLEEQILKELDYSLDEREAMSVLQPYLSEAAEDEMYYAALIPVAHILWQRGYIQTATHIYEDLYTIHAEDSLAYVLAEGLFQYGQYEAALDWLNQLNLPLTDESLNQQAHMLKARILHKGHQEHAALKIVQQLVKDYPTYYPAYELAIQLHDELDHVKEWESFIYAVEEYFPDQIDRQELRRLKIHTYLRKEQIDFQAIFEMLEDSTLPLATTDDLFLASEVYFMAEAYHQSIQYAQELLQLDGDYVDAHLILLENYDQLGQLEGIQIEIDWLVATLPFDHAAIEQVFEIAQKHDYQSADLMQLVGQYLQIVEADEVFYNMLSALLDYASAYPQVELDVQALLGEAGRTEHLLLPLQAKFALLQDHSQQAYDYYEQALAALHPDELLLEEYIVQLLDDGYQAQAFDVYQRYRSSSYLLSPALEAQLQENGGTTDE